MFGMDKIAKKMVAKLRDKEKEWRDNAMANPDQRATMITVAIMCGIMADVIEETL